MIFAACVYSCVIIYSIKIYGKCIIVFCVGGSWVNVCSCNLIGNMFGGYTDTSHEVQPGIIRRADTLVQ